MRFLARLILSWLPFELPTDDEAFAAEVVATWATVYGEK